MERADVRVTGVATAGIRDREWMVVDHDGRFVTQRERPKLALVETQVADGVLTLAAAGAGSVTLPRERSSSPSRDVLVWRSNVRGVDQGDDAAHWVSAFLGAKLRVVRFDDAKVRMCNPDYAGDSGAHTLFSDGYPLLVIGQSSLDDLNARLAQKRHPPLPMNRFRPNVVIEGLDPFAEDHVDTLATQDVTLKLVKPCARCKVTTTDQATGSVGVEPLPTLSMYRRNDALAAVLFGMNAIVVRGAGRALAIGEKLEVAWRF